MEARAHTGSLSYYLVNIHIYLAWVPCQADSSNNKHPGNFAGGLGVFAVRSFGGDEGESIELARALVDCEIISGGIGGGGIKFIRYFACCSD